MSYPHLKLYNVRENNLTGWDIEIPHNELTVITGLSGAGKTSLAFDTIYAEGGRRYMETFSPYMRQFLDRLKRPEIGSIENIRPALALKQRRGSISSRSTVGTATEINDYLKLLWTHYSSIRCIECGSSVINDTPESIVKELLNKKFAQDCILLIGFTVKITSEESLRSVLEVLLSTGFSRVWNHKDKTTTKIDKGKFDISCTNGKEVIAILTKTTVKNLGLQKAQIKTRLRECFQWGRGNLTILSIGKNFKLYNFCEKLICSKCNILHRVPRPTFFSFNSPIGACSSCKGFGKILSLDLDACIPDIQKSLSQGAIQVWKTKSLIRFHYSMIAYCKKLGIPIDVPWEELSETMKEKILNGKDGKTRFIGLYHWYESQAKKAYKIHVKVMLSRLRKEIICPKCEGGKIKPEYLCYDIKGKSIVDFWKQDISENLDFLLDLEKEIPLKHKARRALEEGLGRVKMLYDIGLPYLSLDRSLKTLSGGELQRINITSILGAQLANSIIVLDEPTIGLHTTDTEKLIAAIKGIRNKKNSVLVVEHDTDVIASADRVIDIGPKAGKDGGNLIYQGIPKFLAKNKESLTGKYLSIDNRSLKPLSPAVSDKPPSEFLSIRRACSHNLKNIDVDIPLDRLCVLTGVSGSGKSSLVKNTLIPEMEKAKQNLPSGIEIIGYKKIEEVIWVDQTPVGGTPRANAATHTKTWGLIRELLAGTPEAQSLGLSKSDFSFNVQGGRCIECKGIGSIKVEMQFLSDVYVTCDSCNGNRFQEKIIDIKWNGKGVTDFLSMTLLETIDFFHKQGEKVVGCIDRLQPLIDLGLGYLTLGQPLSKLSGGEAQRVKLASYLTAKTQKPCLFIFDEPTSGLHPHNISQLLTAFSLLFKNGHSVLVVEHNMEIISAADWLIDLGPESGKLGGELVAFGNPKDLLKNKPLQKKSKTLFAINQWLNKEIIAKKKQNKGLNLKPTISISGARHHNLKNISVKIPLEKITCITGVSGSGKSSLAFDILFCEGQRRFIDSLSPYARQFIKQLERPEVDLIESLPPTISISQKTTSTGFSSTIGTITEIYHYLRLLFSKLGKQHCPSHDIPLDRASSEGIAKQIASEFSGKNIEIYAPVVSGRKGNYTALFEKAIKSEIFRARIDGKIVQISENLRLKRHIPHWISLEMGRINCRDENFQLLIETVKQTLALSGQEIEVSHANSKEPHLFTTKRACPICRKGFHKPDPLHFSFHSRRGVCKSCNGKGILKNEKTCTQCNGTRLCEIAQTVKISDKTISDLHAMCAPELQQFLSNLTFLANLQPVASPILREIKSRLKSMIEMGLDYLPLNRDSKSISGGEAQRLRLSRILGSPLTGVCYIFDEPSIGLHKSEHHKLITALIKLKEMGNTVVVVEHDEDAIRAADMIIDLGPEGGVGGGKVVASGSLKQIIDNPNSPTGKELNSKRVSPRSSEPLGKEFTLHSATANNLYGDSATFYTKAINVVCGVSGAGKSSLIHLGLLPALRAKIKTKGAPFITGNEIPSEVEVIEQSPIGRSPSSFPASFLGIFTEIRKLYAGLPHSKANAWEASFFSCNTGKGRCSECNGKGYVKVPMSFLPSATLKCDQCEGRRYREDVSEALYKGKSIADILDLTIAEATIVFSSLSKIYKPLDFLNKLGLGYIKLGQPTATLSGGEAQRLKIARALGKPSNNSMLYILDEPTVGLHMRDIRKLIEMLRTLCSQGHTIVTIEHNQDVIKSADHIIEIGPGPGDKGGRVLKPEFRLRAAENRSADS